jgi:drug/metabolite transporter (DMT)-like permease
MRRSGITNLYGICYGLLLAGTYFLMKRFSVGGGLPVFCVATLLLFILHLGIFPGDTIRGIVTPSHLFRGILFGLTQICLLKAQAEASTATMLMLSAFGGIMGMVGGRLMLQERPTREDIIAGFLTVLGVAVTFDSLLVSFWGIIGGVVQGLTAVLVRGIIRSGDQKRQAVAAGFFYGAITSGLALYVTHVDWAQHLGVAWFPVIATAIVLLLVQYAFFMLFELLDTQRASILVLSRIPGAMVLDTILLGVHWPLRQVASAVLIVLGVIISVIGVRKVRNHDLASGTTA